MIKWPITYTDYNGNEQTEDFYFNLNKAEVMEMNFDANGAYAEYLQGIVDSRDGKAIGKEFKRIITKAYGKKSPDGKRFVKTEEQTAEFLQTEAYSELYMLLATDEEAAKKFMEGVMPKPEQIGAPVPEKQLKAVN